MWRFMLVTFGFLTIAFYQLSGGSSYEPRSNSFQAARSAKHEPVTVVQLEPSNVAAETEPLINPPDNPFADTVSRQATLASLTQIGQQRAAGNKVERVEISAEDTAVQAALDQVIADQGAIALFKTKNQQLALQAELKAEAEPTAEASQDIRYVIGDLVNMRRGPGVQYDKISALTEGTEVAVLRAPGNGWLELQVTATGETGWMADWLISASEVAETE
ncbi:MAG: SH3 domain-containing protein [Pseudomonadota bacterium]